MVQTQIVNLSNSPADKILTRNNFEDGNECNENYQMCTSSEVKFLFEEFIWQHTFSE